MSKIIGQKKQIQEIEILISDLIASKGSVIALSGDSSMGKTHLLNIIFEEYKVNQSIRAVYTDNQEPIGSFKVSMIQPLYPFSKIIQQLMEKAQTAEKKFAVNVGMTTLASLPLIGDVFYAAKEFGRDWRQYKREKSSENARKMNSTVADFYDTIIKVSDKQPVLILLDNMENADSISIELLQNLTENISGLPVSIIFTFNPSTISNKIGPFESYLIEHQSKGEVKFLNLESFNLDGIRQFCKQQLPEYKPNAQFEEWLQDKTYGIPGVIEGYLRHFEKKSAFLESGEIDFTNTEIFPENLNKAFTNSIQDLSDDDVNLLSVCSVEGREFSAYLCAQLMNTDVLSAIKRLKALQSKTGIFRSLGAKPKYGIISTVYEFTQAYYHSYFDGKLEYEERVSLHSQLANHLKKRLEETNDKNLKNELAPYIVAHSMISGDEETAKEMLVMSAKAANEIDSKEIIENAFNIFNEINTKSTEETENTTNSLLFNDLLGRSIISMPGLDNETKEGLLADGNYPIDFNFVRRMIVEEYHKGNYSKSTELAETYMNNHSGTLKPSEKAQILTLIARCEIETGQLDFAETHCKEAHTLAIESKELVAEAFASNVMAIIQIEKGKPEEAYALLQNAAKKTIKLPPEIRLVTLSNIAILLKEMNDRSSEKFFMAVRRLSKQLNFEEFAIDVFK
jgi:hypothetical protein